MIDNYAQAMELMRQIQMQLPIPAYPIKALVQTMTRRGVKLNTTQELSIKSVLYLGDEGGIMCDITPSGQRDPIICSLTHLQISTSHLLGAAIHAYQQQRINRLAGSGDRKNRCLLQSNRERNAGIDISRTVRRENIQPSRA